MDLETKSIKELWYLYLPNTNTHMIPELFTKDITSGNLNYGRWRTHISTRTFESHYEILN